MFCLFQYIDYKNFEFQQKLPSSQSEDMLQKETVNKELIFNPHCLLQIILDYIFEVIGFNSTGDYDFYNTTDGLVHIKTHKATTNGAHIFKPKQIYVLIFFEKNTAGMVAAITPMLAFNSLEYISTIASWEKMQNPVVTRKSKSKTKGRKVSRASRGSSSKFSSSTQMSRSSINRVKSAK